MSAAPVVTISKVVGTQSEYFQPLGAKTPYMVDKNDASTIVQLGEISFLEDEMLVKVRKPYTITKQREKWTESEHQRFLEALKLYGRGWRQIEEHIGTKNAVQIRSHAQKFFSKLEKEQAIGGNLTDTAQDIDIPPPRPKRKPNHPYPRKAQAPISSATTQNYSSSASAVFPSGASTLCVVAGSYFQTALSTPLQAPSARKESDQMHPGGITSSLLCNSVGLKIFGQTFAPEIHSSTDSEETMPNSNYAYANEMPAAKACGTAVQETFSFSQSINGLQSVEAFDTRSLPENSSIGSNCASDAGQLQVSDVEALNINNMNESLCITKDQKKSKENLQYQKTASKTNVNIVGYEHKVEGDHPIASNLKTSDGSGHQRNIHTEESNYSNALFSTCSDGSNLECEANVQSVPRMHDMCSHQHTDSKNASALHNLLMMHRRHAIIPIDATSFAATFTNMSGSFEHPVFCRVPNLAYVPGPVTLARPLDPFLQHVMHGARKYDSAAFTSSLPGTPTKVDSAQMPVRNCSNDMVAEPVDVAAAAAVATLAAASAWWALQESMALSNLNDCGFPFNASHPTAVHSAATAALPIAFCSLDGSKEAMVQEFPSVAGRDIAIHQKQDPKINFQKTNMSRGGNMCDLISNTNHTISDQYIRKAVSSSCISSDCDGNKGVGGSIGKDYSYDCGHLRKQVSLFTSHEQQGLDEHKNSSITSKDQRRSEIGNAKHSCREFTGNILSFLEQHQSCKEDKYQQHCNSESQQCQSRIALKNSAAYMQLDGKDERSKSLKDSAFSFMDSDAQTDSSTRIDGEGDLPCADYGSHLKIPDLVIEREEENVKACQEARKRAASSPDSVLNFDEVSHKENICALNSLVGSSSPSRKRKYSSAVGFRPYQPPSRRTSVALSSSSNE